MSKEKEPTLEPVMSPITELRTETVFRAKNIHQYVEIIYWMLRVLREQDDIKDSTLAAIKLHLDAIKSNTSNLESEIYEFINKTTKKEQKND